MSGLKFPKPKRAPKVRKGLRRSRKPISNKSVFKEWGKNTTKTYRRKFTDVQVMAKAEEVRRKRLADPTEAETALEAILSGLGVSYEREKIILNGDRFCILDCWLPRWNLCIEADGFGHLRQKQYDHGRSMWLARQHGMKVVRFLNAEVLNGQAEKRIRTMLGLY